MMNKAKLSTPPFSSTPSPFELGPPDTIQIQCENKERFAPDEKPTEAQISSETIKISRRLEFPLRMLTCRHAKARRMCAAGVPSVDVNVSWSKSASPCLGGPKQKKGGQERRQFNFWVDGFVFWLGGRGWGEERQVAGQLA